MEPPGRNRHTLILSYQLLALYGQAKLWCLGCAWLEGVQRVQQRRRHTILSPAYTRTPGFDPIIMGTPPSPTPSEDGDL